MKRIEWEYKSYTTRKYKENSKEYRRDEDRINDMGEHGWELVSIIESEIYNVLSKENEICHDFWFKREKEKVYI